MGAKDLIWVCWQEPAVDCGKTSQIPFSWVTEVMIGDGRAPGSVLKCRWPKTRRQYTAKVIAPPSGNQERSQMNILRIPLASGSGSGDDDAASSVAEIIAGSLKTSQSNGSEEVDRDSTRGNSLSLSSGDGPQNRPASKDSYGSSDRSPAVLSVDGSDRDFESDMDAHDQRPPCLIPETDSFDTPDCRQTPAGASSVTAAPPSTFRKELQKWFVLQLNGLKTELLNNFDQVNHKISAMDLSIRSIRDRVNQMEGKIDVALLSLSPNAEANEVNVQAWQRQATSVVSKGSDISDGPPPLKRQCGTNLVQESSIPGAAQNGGRNGEVQDLKESWRDTNVDSPAMLAISVTSTPPVPKRNARKSIVHRPAPISPPPLLMKQTALNQLTDRRVSLQLMPPVITRMTPIAPAASSHLSAASATKMAYKRRRSASPMVAQYKPGSNNQIILLGGDPNYEISRELYAETLENVYEETPVYLILSLVRRLLCDQDVAKLWFKADLPTQPNTYAFRPAFAEALKRQAIMQYPQKPLTERDFVMKLNQATYDAKHRVKHGKGTTSRPTSYFALGMIAIPIAPSIPNDDDTKKPRGQDDQGSTPGKPSDRASQDTDGEVNSDETVSEGVSAHLSAKIKEEEDDSSTSSMQQQHEDDPTTSNISNTMAMLAELATVLD